jgi:hypothetical protein
MPGSLKRTRTRSIHSSPSLPSAQSRSRALLVIDNAPLQNAAWADYHSAQKRLTKASRDLHRHEEMDVPAYEAWVHRTFPVYVSTLRELHQEVFTKGRQVESVQAMAALTGRSVKKLWREQKEHDADPEAFESKFHSETEEDDYERSSRSRKSADDDFFRDDDRSEDSHHSRERGRFDFGSRESRKINSKDAKDVYRRLVQRLHPDRGGEWSAARKRVWHEVQQAWAAGDVDWLTRLEVEWEAANEILGPKSPISRLRQAIEELAGARRDIERKLRDYRRAVQWRFTLSEKKREQLHRRIEANFQHDIEFLRRQLAYLNATIAAWESPLPNRRSYRTEDRRYYG